jgi:hypothetical protein
MIDPIWTGASKPWPTLEIRVALRKTSTQDIPDMTATRESVQQYEQALATYMPMLLPVPIVVFSAIFDGRPWHQVSPEFKLFEIPGGHFDLVTARSDVFAAHLRDQLKDIGGRTRPHVSAAHLEKLAQELYGAIRDLQLKARALTEERDDLRAQVATFAEERASLNWHAEALATERDGLKGTVAERNEELDALRASSCWRITATLRRTARFLRNGKL